MSCIQLVLAGVAFEELELDEIVHARDVQKQHCEVVEERILTNVFDLAAVGSPCHLGRDRLYRSYFLLEAIPLLLVEAPNEKDNPGPCGHPTPAGDKVSECPEGRML